MPEVRKHKGNNTLLQVKPTRLKGHTLLALLVCRTVPHHSNPRPGQVSLSSFTLSHGDILLSTRSCTALRKAYSPPSVHQQWTLLSISHSRNQAVVNKLKQVSAQHRLQSRDHVHNKASNSHQQTQIQQYTIQRGRLGDWTAVLPTLTVLPCTPSPRSFLSHSQHSSDLNMLSPFYLPQISMSPPP